MKGYFTTRISEGRQETPEGFLIVPDCVIARTGFQSYAVKDLPQESAADLGVDVSNPSANIDLYRRPEDVFSPDTLRSFEGKTICEGHPADFVDPKNFNDHAQGHIQNVRKGPEALESGDWPMIADLHFTAEPLLSKVKNHQLEELSCGYDFSIARDGQKICQTDITGNHVAVVPKGRAGPEARINDSHPSSEVLETKEHQAQPLEPKTATDLALPEPSAVAYPPITLTFRKKEKQPVAEKKQSSWLRSLMGKHLIEKARATDADPDKIMDEAEGMLDEVEVPGNTQANEFKSADKKGKDGELPEALKEHEFKKGDKAKDSEEEEMDDRRKAAHDALDAILDRTDGQETDVPKVKAKDADIEELKKLMDEFREEEDEPDTEELEKVIEGDAADCPDCGMAMDECECPGMEMDESGEEDLVGDEEGESPDPDSDDDQEDVEDRKRAKDRARGTDAASKARAADAAMATLRLFRPFAARSKDKAFQNAFNRALDSVKKTSKPSTGGYGKFAAAARARDKAPRNPNPDRARAGDNSGKADPITALQAMYDASHKGGK